MPEALTKSEVPPRKHKPRAVRKRRLRLLGAVALLLVVAVTWTVVADASSKGPAAPEATAADTTATAVASGGTPHPVFGRVEGKNLILPVPADETSIIAYHAVSDEDSVALEPLGERVNGNLVARGVERVVSGTSDIRYHVLENKGRVVTETGAVDIGAPAGTEVVSPVTGEVVSVKSYKLYGKYDDYQVDIRPKSASDIIVSLLLVASPQVHIKQSVEAGKTVIGAVREPVPELAERLTPLTGDSGSHIHLQVSASPAPIE